MIQIMMMITHKFEEARRRKKCEEVMSDGGFPESRGGVLSLTRTSTYVPYQRATTIPPYHTPKPAYHKCLHTDHRTTMPPCRNASSSTICMHKQTKENDTFDIIDTPAFCTHACLDICPTVFSPPQMLPCPVIPPCVFSCVDD